MSINKNQAYLVTMDFHKKFISEELPDVEAEIEAEAKKGNFGLRYTVGGFDIDYSQAQALAAMLRHKGFDVKVEVDAYRRTALIIEWDIEWK